MLTKDIHWLAGLLEGEAAFHVVTYKTRVGRVPRHRARITLQMNDEDTMQKVHKLMGVTSKILRRERSNRMATEPSYMIQTESNRAVGWMMTLYPLMSSRRRKQIRKCLAAFMSTPPRRRTATGC